MLYSRTLLSRRSLLRLTLLRDIFSSSPTVELHPGSVVLQDDLTFKYVKADENKPDFCGKVSDRIRFFSPEELNEGKERDVYTFVWRIGLMIFYLLSGGAKSSSGIFPFEKCKTIASLKAAQQKSPPNLLSLPHWAIYRDWCVMINTCFSFNRKDRPSVGELKGYFFSPLFLLLLPNSSKMQSCGWFKRRKEVWQKTNKWIFSSLLDQLSSKHSLSLLSFFLKH